MVRYNMEIYLVAFTLILIFLRLHLNRVFYNSSEYKRVHDEVQDFASDITNMSTDYIRNSNKVKTLEKYEKLNEFLKSNKRYTRGKKSSEINLFINTFNNFDKYVSEHNEKYVNEGLVKYEEFFGNIKGKSLDESQRRAVLINEDNNLIIAGAGTGKTLTIQGKVMFLVEKCNIDPSEILLLSFTKKSASELQEKLNNNSPFEISASTFHKLGYDILTRTTGYRRNVFDDFDVIANDYFRNKAIEDEKFCKDTVIFFGLYLDIIKDITKFECLGEAIDNERNTDNTSIKQKISLIEQSKRANKVSLKNEKMRSKEEVLIANFLYLNGINYEYEMEYPFDSNDNFRKKYKPDFYLVDYDIYLEHFGINKDMKAPWLSKIEEKKYIDGMEWKRKVHRENGTTLIESFSYFNENNLLQFNIKKLLGENNVKFTVPDFRAIYKNLFIESEDRYFGEFKKLIKTFIGLSKSNLIDVSKLRNIYDHTRENETNEFLRNRTMLFLDIVIKIYANYEQYLHKIDEIDFNDMINQACELISGNRYKFPVKYIIVDEYQDIATNRYKLIDVIKKQNEAILFAVGDDWQSIYKFTGSNISLFTKFENFNYRSEINQINKTYRNSQELIDLAGNFIMKNDTQIKKKLKSDINFSNPIRYVRFNDKYDKVLSIIKILDELANVFIEQSTVFLLGRNNFDIDFLKLETVPESRTNENKNEYDQILKTNELLGKFEIRRVEDELRVFYRDKSTFEIKFLTVHKSKGLEADNVIVLNLENSLTGFPNRIADDPVLNLVQENFEEIEFAEERRLFYVALTRSKNFVYLLVPEHPSVFISELVKDNKIKIENIYSFERSNALETVECNVCKTGNMVVREDSNGKKFLGCNNFPKCQNTISDISLVNNKIICPICGGYMVKRLGKFGDFYGCTNYPYCRKTIELDLKR